MLQVWHCLVCQSTSVFNESRTQSFLKVLESWILIDLTRVLMKTYDHITGLDDPVSLRTPDQDAQIMVTLRDTGLGRSVTPAKVRADTSCCSECCRLLQRCPAPRSMAPSVQSTAGELSRENSTRLLHVWTWMLESLLAKYLHKMNN